MRFHHQRAVWLQHEANARACPKSFCQTQACQTQACHGQVFRTQVFQQRLSRKWACRTKACRRRACRQRASRRDARFWRRRAGAGPARRGRPRAVCARAGANRIACAKARRRRSETQLARVMARPSGQAFRAFHRRAYLCPRMPACPAGGGVAALRQRFYRPRSWRPHPWRPHPWRRNPCCPAVLFVWSCETPHYRECACKSDDGKYNGPADIGSRRKRIAALP